MEEDAELGGWFLALSGPCSPAWHHGRWAVSSPPYWAWLSPRKREGLVLTHPCALSPCSTDPTGLYVTASCNGRRSWLAFKARGEERHGTAPTGQILATAKGRGNALKENYHLFDSRGVREELNSSVRIHSVWGD